MNSLTPAVQYWHTPAASPANSATGPVTLAASKHTQVGTEWQDNSHDLMEGSLELQHQLQCNVYQDADQQTTKTNT